jgi:hypothetical protein
MNRDITNALAQSYALILIMADETHSPRTARAWERAKRALEKAGVADLTKPTKH